MFFEYCCTRRGIIITKSLYDLSHWEWHQWIEKRKIRYPVGRYFKECIKLTSNISCLVSHCHSYIKCISSYPIWTFYVIVRVVGHDVLRKALTLTGNGWHQDERCFFKKKKYSCLTWTPIALNYSDDRRIKSLQKVQIIGKTNSGRNGWKWHQSIEQKKFYNVRGRYLEKC